MQPVALAEQQLVVRDLAQQRVPERIAADAVGIDEDPAAHRLTQRVGDFRMGRLEDGGQDLVIDAPPRGGRRAQHLPGPRRKIGESCREHLAQARSERPVAIRDAVRSGRELLEVERVPAGPLRQVLEAVGGQACHATGGEQIPALRAVERSKLQPVHAGIAVQLGEEVTHLPGRVEVVGPDEQDEEHPRPARVAQQELEELEGAGVRPLQVVDDHHARRATRQRRE